MSVRIENVDVEAFLEKLKRKGWCDGSDIVSAEKGELVPFFFEGVLRDAIRKRFSGRLWIDFVVIARFGFSITLSMV